MKKITGHISFRLFVLLFAVLLLSLAISTFFSMRLQHNHLMANVLDSATRISDVILRSTHNSMLLNRREDLRASIKMIGTEPGMEGVRILNKKGQIVFSANVDEQGRVVDLKAEACVICHSADLPLTTVSSQASSRIYRGAGGDRILGVITAVRNSPDCSNEQIICDANQVQQALIALLVNAVQAMPQGGTLTVRLRQDEARHGICIDVQDTGTGIAPEIINQVFDPFFTTKKDGRGMGLGLSVAYGIVTGHGGDIQVRNIQPHGALFTMFFPAQPNCGTASPVSP